MDTRLRGHDDRFRNAFVLRSACPEEIEGSRGDCVHGSTGHHNRAENLFAPFLCALCVASGFPFLRRASKGGRQDWFSKPCEQEPNREPTRMYLLRFRKTSRGDRLRTLSCPARPL